jgi:tetratricopeptide (TPR) repeat protein
MCRCTCPAASLRKSLRAVAALASTISCIAATDHFPWLTRPYGKVLFQREGRGPEQGITANWPLYENDIIRTLESSGAWIEYGPGHVQRLKEMSQTRILPKARGQRSTPFQLLSGILYIFSRDDPGEVQFSTPDTAGAGQGTDFVIEVLAGQSRVWVLHGSVLLTNAYSGESVEITSQEEGVVETNQPGPPTVRSRLETERGVQWWLYYPAVLVPQDLQLADDSRAQLDASLRAYESGDLLGALRQLPPDFRPRDGAETNYYAAVLLSAGKVQEAVKLLEHTETSASPARALLRLVDVVQNRQTPWEGTPSTASEWLSRSYHEQGREDHARPEDRLKCALEAARQAVVMSGGRSGFALVRLAELEFAHGRTVPARNALKQALAIAPRHAQAAALEGFVLAAENRIEAARDSFERAIDLDPRLGNAWLGRGLVRLRRGDREERLEAYRDLTMATALEPNRSLFHSYLAKAFSNASREAGVTEDRRRLYRGNVAGELEFAKSLDRLDPTPLLYEGLDHYQDNRLRDAVEAIAASQDLNDQRAVYRSQHLLDQDRAVRSFSLARIYRDAGLRDLGINEATRAVDADYGNASAHLFLADGWNERRDPARVNLRFETAWFSELLLANLYAPVGSATISQNISLEEYSRLFEREGLGLTSFTEVRSDADIRQLASQTGWWENSSYTLDLDSQFKDGTRPNNDLTRIEWYSQVKQQLSPKDSLFLLTKYHHIDAGDNLLRYDPDDASADYRFVEKQEPLLFLAWQREWQPGIRTVLAASRLVNEQTITQLDGGRADWTILTSASNSTVGFFRERSLYREFRDDGQFETYGLELNQLVQFDRHRWILGARLQAGRFETRNGYSTRGPGLSQFPVELDSDTVKEDFHRFSAYYYHYLELPLGFTASYGVTYDDIRYPANYKVPPITAGTEHADQISPKAGFRWSPSDMITVRGMYSQALGGVNFDESFRLEPTQIAGFNQAFRSVISETELNPVSAPAYEFAGGAIDLRLSPSVFVSLESRHSTSEVKQRHGVFERETSPPAPVYSVGFLREDVNYSEWTAGLSLNAFLDRNWSTILTYRYVDSTLDLRYPQYQWPADPTMNPNRTEQARLHNLTVALLFNHESGIYGRFEADFYDQVSEGYEFRGARPGDTLLQFNLFAGLRFWDRRADLAFGILNLTDQDYRLNSLNVYSELPREFTFVSRIRVNF